MSDDSAWPSKRTKQLVALGALICLGLSVATSLVLRARSDLARRVHFTRDQLAVIATVERHSSVEEWSQERQLGSAYIRARIVNIRTRQAFSHHIPYERIREEARLEECANGDGDLLDGWNHPIVYRRPGYVHARGWDVYSVGPNGIDEMGGGDDILVGEDVADVVSER